MSVLHEQLRVVGNEFKLSSSLRWKKKKDNQETDYD